MYVILWLYKKICSIFLLFLGFLIFERIVRVKFFLNKVVDLYYFKVEIGIILFLVRFIF